LTSVLKSDTKLYSLMSQLWLNEIPTL
jgi:hypothetical protein